MKRRSRKPHTRPVARTHPGLLAALDGMGAHLIEGIVGLWLGLALTVLVSWCASAEFQRSLTGEAMLGTPDHLCQPRIGGGPYLDGDRVTLAGGDLLICNGVTGGWESPAARDAREAGFNASLPLIE
jgi:hypothetical protein